MVKQLSKLFGAKPAPRPHGPVTPSSQRAEARPASVSRQLSSRPPQFYSKTFRWSPAAGSSIVPSSVQLVGSFSQWEPVALNFDARTQVWSVTLDQIPSNRTHHYMLLVDGQPTAHAGSDGVVEPSSFEESQFQLETPRGPRVLLLFAQTK